MTRELSRTAEVDAEPLPLPGTLRTRTPEHTWSLIEPRLRHYGVTRVAELTALDVIGMPVYMAVRPLATTVGVSQGKGATPLLARLSATMEAVEVCVAERFRPAESLWATAAELSLPYPVEETTPTERSVISADLPLPWVPAISLADGAETHVPLHTVGMDGLADGRWRPRSIVISTNGLASGNSVGEATVQALLEAVERHSTADLAQQPIEQRRVLDLATLPAGFCRDLIERMRSLGFWIEAVDCSTLPGTAAFTVYVWRPDMPSMYAGAGCHVLPETALFRALTEAVQSRMSVISGVREDLGDVAYRGVRRPATPPPVEPNHDWAAVPAPTAPLGGPFPVLARWLTERVTAVSGLPVLRVDLTPPEEPFAVCKVVAPGLAFDVYRELPRDTGEVRS
ncbi:YcaO-like family protein [Amycolatopsis sp. H20-H5]|uniref:YcaO-like family protein n=1 Tax=Amycolatopsis sp. H20-H5 TaxID=3046309 RepID=UPI002DB98156|nr:YcaO-like family protein [Amycolatopsis sp. H20-H5]MEC3976877.1 YcaO-like family protein [Amycolatopsis sp. H20-H5]